jgi:hypothetical protein
VHQEHIGPTAADCRRDRRCADHIARTRPTPLSHSLALLSYADSTQGGENSEEIEQPNGHANDHDPVEDRFDGSLHGDETIHEPQQYAHRNESDNNLNEWNGTLASLFQLQLTSGELLFAMVGSRGASMSEQFRSPRNAPDVRNISRSDFRPAVRFFNTQRLFPGDELRLYAVVQVGLHGMVVRKPVMQDDVQQ